MKRSDNAIVALILAAIAWLASLSYLFGRSTNKIDNLTDQQKDMAQTNKRIFERIDEMSRHLPHRCEQTTVLADLAARVRAIETRMDRNDVRHGEESA